MNRALKTLAVFLVFVVIYTVSRHGLGSTPSSVTTVVTSNVTTTSTTTTIVTGTTTSTVAPVGHCRSSDLHGVFNEGQGAAGTIYASVTLTKITPGACSLTGWPQLVLQSKTGATLTSLTIDLPTTSSPIVFPAAQANSAPTTLTLAPNATASFSLAYSDVAPGTEVCSTATTIGIRLGSAGSMIVVEPTYPIQPCNHGTVWVSPFY